MPFKKGVVTNLKGRGLGTPNKNTKDIKQAYQDLIEKNLDNLTEWLETVAEKDPEKAIRILNDLSEYVIPKLARRELTGKEGKDLIPARVLTKEEAKDYFNSIENDC